MNQQNCKESKIDIFLLAGQSNAAGSSGFESAGEEDRDSRVYEHVSFFFHRVKTDGTTVRDLTNYEPVREGLGFADDRIGPELGMAEILNAHYDGVTRKALILKCAAGGTSLLMHENPDGTFAAGNERTEASVERFLERGSWYPELLCQPQLRRKAEENPGLPTSFLTRRFKADVKRVLKELRTAGYQMKNIRFVSLNWMQGEDDRKYPEEYARVFGTFAREIREYLSVATGADYSKLPIVVGEISETFSSALPESIDLNRRFIAMQDQLAEQIPELYVIPTRGFLLNKLENGENIPVGQDKWHWNYRDMRAIGRVFGEKSLHIRQELDRHEKELNPVSGEEVPDPTLFSPMKEAPVYGFDHEPSVDELRKTAVWAMHDMLSVEWYTPESFAYRKGGAAAGKSYEFEKGVRYAGLPYTDFNATLFGMLEYLDSDGRLRTETIEDPEYPTLGQSLNRKLGNTCSGSTGFGLYAVANSIRGNLVSYTLTVRNGFYPVGDFSYDETIEEFAQIGMEDPVTTVKICKQYGEQRIFQCYASACPGDLLNMQGDERSKGHSMMVIEKAKIVLNGDGTIDPERSTIAAQDQRTGGYKLPYGPDGEEYCFSGRIRFEHTFRSLYDQGYIPLTIAEFQGKKTYERAYAKLSSEGKVQSAEELMQKTVRSNYPLAVMKLLRKKPDGGEERIAFHVFNRGEVGSGKAFQYPVREFLEDVPEERLTKKEGETLLLTATVTTGERFTLAEF